MAHQTRTYRREVYRIPQGRPLYLTVRRPQVRRVLRVLQSMFRYGA